MQVPVPLLRSLVSRDRLGWRACVARCRPCAPRSLIILLTTIVTYFAMMWLYDQVGYVRLLGIVHVVIWTPLAIYLWQRLKNAEIVVPFRQIIWVFLATMVVSLAFDYADVVRYLLGERGSMVR